MTAIRTLLAPGLALALGLPAAAGAEPTWKAQAKAGLVSTTGNARTTTLTVGANASRKDDGNKFTLDGLLAYGRSGVLVIVDADADGFAGPGEISRETRTTANAWTLKARYDRTFAPKNGFFVAALLGADAPGGKDLASGPVKDSRSVEGSEVPTSWRLPSPPGSARGRGPGRGAPGVPTFAACDRWGLQRHAFRDHPQQVEGQGGEEHD